MKKIKYIIGIIILIVISYMAVGYADYLYDSSNVEYNNSNSTLNSTSVQGAIDELYSKVNDMANSSDCPNGYNKTGSEDRYMCSKSNLAKKCYRATDLHTEICNTSYCGTSGSTITYGSLGTSGTLTSGDAFDCDVTGRGDWERFYYVSDYYDTYTQTFDNTYAVLVYYANTIGGKINFNYSTWYADTNLTGYGPVNAKNNMPETGRWNNINLKTTTRNIRDETGTIIKSNFSYEGKAARLLTYQEIYQGCYHGHSITSSGGLRYNHCEYLLEKTRYAGSYEYGIWIETVKSANRNYQAFYIYSNYLEGLAVNTGYYAGARPAIEVPKSQIAY